MSKMSPQDRKVPRQKRNAEAEIDEQEDAGERLVAELQSRRARLRELLSLVLTEAARTQSNPVHRVAARTHSRGHSAGIKQIA
jgi:hypothetical protein